MSCPGYNPITGRSICPDCEKETLDDDENTSEETLQYCGPGCSNCGWQHCGGCI
jgi:hypothetical protein